MKMKRNNKKNRGKSLIKQTGSCRICSEEFEEQDAKLNNADDNAFNREEIKGNRKNSMLNFISQRNKLTAIINNNRVTTRKRPDIHIKKDIKKIYIYPKINYES